MTKFDWKKKIEEITHYFSTREIMLMSPANRMLAEQHNRKLFDLKKCIREVLSSQLSDLKKEMEILMDKKQAKLLGDNLEMEFGKRECKYCGYNPEKQREMILSLLDKKAGGKK